MCPDGPGSSGQTGHTDTGGQYMHFKWISGKKPERIDNGIMHFKLASVDEGGRIVCGQRSFVSKSSRKRHMDTMHKNIYRYRCETCDRGFTDRLRFHNHVAAHSPAAKVRIFL